MAFGMSKCLILVVVAIAILQTAAGDSQAVSSTDTTTTTSVPTTTVPTQSTTSGPTTTTTTTATTTVTITTPPSACPLNDPAGTWIQNPANGLCYYFSPQPVSYFDAITQCKRRNSTLVEIQSQDVDQWIRKEAANQHLFNYWVGATCQVQQSSAQGCVWLSGNFMTYTNFEGSEPGASIGVINNVNSWITTRPDSEFSFVCGDVTHQGCPVGWLPDPVRNLCYFFTPDTNDYTWSTAKTYCDSHDAVLIEIHDQAQETFLGNLMQNHNLAGGQYWFGLIRVSKTGDTLRWLTDRPFTETFFNVNNQDQLDESCSILFPDGQQLVYYMNPCGEGEGVGCMKSAAK